MGVHLDFGAQVWTADGYMVGLVAGVVTDPGRRAVTHLVVRYGLVVAVERVVAVGDARTVQDHRVQLAITAEQLGEMPELEVRAYVSLGGLDVGTEERPAVSQRGLWTRTPAIALPPLVSNHTTDQGNVEQLWRNVPEGSLVLREGLAVRARNGRLVGRLKEVVMDRATGTLTHIVISRGAHVKAVPAGWIERSDEETGFVLAVDRDAVDGLPDDH